MAEDGPEPEGLKDFATRKVGPFPVWLYAVLFVGAWYYLERRKSASSSAAAASTTTGSSTTSSNYGTDPAGNTGEINPETGYVYGSAEDTAALQQQSSSTSTTTTYADNNAWGQAAINYLVGLGDDATVANAAIEAYLGSQQLTTSQQAMVNSAIQRLGAPPQPPTPTTTTPVVAPPGGATTYATNPPTGLTVSSTSGSSITLKWNAATNATGYTVTVTPSSGGSSSAHTVTVTTPLATISGLTPSTTYSVKVQATPADAGAASATTTAKTTFSVVGTPVGTKPIGTTGDYPLTPGQEIRVQVNIVKPKTMQSVANQFGISLAHLIEVNPGSSASTTGVVLVPYLVKKGDTIASIAAKFGISTEHLEAELAQEGVI